MKAKEMPMGARVSMSHQRWKKGNIVSNHCSDGDEVVLVEWRNEYDSEKIEKINVNDLRLILVPLEDDFNKISEQLRIAGLAIKAANEIAVKSGSDLYEWSKEEAIDMEQVFGPLDTAGWSTSSMTRDC